MELVSVKVLVIGGVAAGTKAAAKLKREDRGLDVSLITKDQDIYYAGCGLPYYVGGMIESRDELIVNTPEKYAALTGVRVLTGREAVELDSGKKLVTAKNLITGETEAYSYDRLVIATPAGLSRVEAGGTPGTSLAEAGASLARVADFACRQGLAGLEFAHGIPGTVGGAVCMNAGAYGGEMAQVVREATLLLPEEGIRTLTGAEMAFGYRRSFLTDHPDAVVLRAEFCLTPGDPAAIRGRMKELLEKRRASQPLEFPSAGSTFKRPEGYYAGTLIDQCGLKGLTVGGAQVSEKHAGFVINRGGATCADVKELIRQIQERVFAQAGVRLEPEVRIID